MIVYKGTARSVNSMFDAFSVQAKRNINPLEEIFVGFGEACEFK